MNIVTAEVRRKDGEHQCFCAIRSGMEYGRMALGARRLNDITCEH